MQLAVRPCGSAPRLSPKARGRAAFRKNSKRSTPHTVNNCAKSSGVGSPISRVRRRSQAVRSRTRSTGRRSTWRSRNLCPEAQAAAGNVLASGSSARGMPRPGRLGAGSARAENGEHDLALDDLKTMFTNPKAGVPAVAASMTDGAGRGRSLPPAPDSRRAVRFGPQALELACGENTGPALKEHFKHRMARLVLVGQAAPQISGTDVDGHPVSLAGFKGKVVLVDFWATWCPPCVAAIPSMSALERKYRDRGFVILGVNVDAMHEDVKEAKTALINVRRFLVETRVTRPTRSTARGPPISRRPTASSKSRRTS